MAEKISAVILAGGLARRMKGVEKGLQLLNEKPLISHILAKLSPQVSDIWLNINREFKQYQQFYPDLPHYRDSLPDFQGPLSGMLSGLEQIDSDYLLFVPCDSPFLPANLLQKLHTALRINDAQIAYAHDGERAHPTFALVHHSVKEALSHYLASGERRLLWFFQSQKSVAVDFSEQKYSFSNFNTLDELAQVSPFPIKTLAITGYSGTGKTTLLEKLIPKLTACGIRVGLIKHSHHNVEIDKKGKDSYRLREAGANPTMVVCDERWALMTETKQSVEFFQLIAKFDPLAVDLVLMEGFKHEQMPKIQLHRKEIDKPLPELDGWTIATATDYPLDRENVLDINNVEQIAEFINAWLQTIK
ncbi:molybdenum cofactor guanylyltransferase MobA [Mannheimia granulomatis]|uniref:molybdenum cofactor guanylyltransferase MobA n=1 Tax=Mannheimia granulomatis TaxID=85402 RepID=UPI00047C8198|nr:molybdenum cofactor guanylyltransferase MobA [Mannheimia granulomatis]QLB19616.1 bifunctional molybdenum cofactor guanylyltransferase MobA/molybdopterin-guanine dinucleotide biosynthesis adaptor protein MobB [Mannheimia granulomatis]